MAYPPPQGGPPTSFKTNVNRAKTKRWVEAKSYSYDGDDWGEMDEYDEYGGYGEPPSPPRPTGLRQRGQSASRDQQTPPPIQPAGYGHPQPSQQAYGDLGRQPPSQQQYGVRSVTNPPYQQSQLQRSGSFDRGDERRAFSAAGPHHGPPPTSGMSSYAPSPAPAPQYYQSGEPLPHPSHYPDMQARNYYQDRNQSQPASNSPLPYSEHHQRTSMGSRTQSMTSNNSTNDLHSRRDFSPSAVPPPLHTRDSPSPQRPSELQSASRPPRKSSLGQQNHPEQLYARQGSMAPAEMDQENRPSALRERAGSDLSKPLPFVRPADIYRRMQEEKEREGQSQDSSKPSMDSIMPDELPDEYPRNVPRSDSIGASERSGDAEHRDALRSSTHPVVEGRSEHDTKGSSSNETELGKASAAQRTDFAETTKRVGPTGINTGLSPQLPDVARMSGFGELFASAPRKPEASPATSAPQRDDTAHFLPDQHLQGRSDSPLQHQPSLGFRSVVHQAFDTTNEPIPETPTSSTADSSIGRSGSGGTSAVSPIISRGPSSATTKLNFKSPQIRPATPPAADESVDGDERPMSSGSLSTPKADPRRPSPDPADQRPARFIPGHRRDLSTPSPDNSPARTPALEANKRLRQPEEAELTTTTPIETRFPLPYERPSKPLSGRISPAKSISTVEPKSPIKSPTDELPNSPAESTRSRVRNLADKFESGRSSPAGSDRAPSPVKMNFVPHIATSQPRPLPADRLESFRPKLPGGWESSASITPLAAPTRTEASSSVIPLEQRLQNTVTDRPSLSDTLPMNTGPQVEAQHPRGSGPPQAQEVSPDSDPFASLAAAGSALVGAFSTAMGSEDNDSNRDRSPVKGAQQFNSSSENEDRRKTTPNVSMNTNYIPEASKPMMLATPDDGTSSIMPTPLDKISQPGLSGDNTSADYFATNTAPPQQMAVDSNATQDSASRKRPVLLPSLSTDNGSQYESDRLRREIIRELSPGLNREPNTADSDSPMQDDLSSSRPRPQHESLIIPREYDSYWNASGSEQSSRASSVKGPSHASREAMQGYNENQTTVFSPLDANKPPPVFKAESPQTQDEMLERPGMPPHRFSWEATSEHSTPKPPPLQSLPPPSPQNIGERDDGLGASGASSLPHRGILSQQAVDIADPGQTSRMVGTPSLIGSHQNSIEPQGDNYVSEAKRSMESARSNPRDESENPTYRDLPGPDMIEPEPLSTDGEPHEHQLLDSTVDTTESTTKPLGAMNDLPLPSMPPSIVPKIQSFREILSLKEPRDRIKGYNETREQFANINTGLEHWLAVTTTELSEHKEILPNGRLAGTPGAKLPTSRIKLGGLLPSGSSIQQSYHASPLSGASDGAQVPGGNTNLGYSPSSGSVRLSSQQMQARGKDLLHTAGLFSGKANVAAKGLFSKGKSKLRGANAEKAPTSSFTDQDRGSPTIQQATQSSPVAPKSDVSFEQSQSIKRSVSSRPGSYINSSEQRTNRSLSPEDLEPRQPPSIVPSSPDIGSESTAPSTTISTRLQPPMNDQGANLSPNDHIADGVPTAERTQANVKDHPEVNKDHSEREVPHDGQMQSVQRTDPTASNNRTPTQADYADYFRRGSSPTAIVPEASVSGMKRETPDGETPNQQRSIQREGLPTLQSKYSSKTPTEASVVDKNPTNPEVNQPSMEPERLQRESEDSDGTFHTAGSNVGLVPTNAAIGAHRNTQSVDQESSAESSVSRSSSRESSSITPPVAVPAANIRDQPKARPFSFIQFSQKPASKPLENNPHRRPSIDSLPSRIDPEQDVPPSPISPQHSMIHEPHDQLGGRSLDHHEFSPNNTRPVSSTPSRSFSRPFKEPKSPNYTALPRDHPATGGDDLPAQHYPAPMPRQDPIHPRQQATEYSLAGVGPPPVSQTRPRATESRSSSKRGSRSSAFFKSFRSPTDAASPPLAGEREELDHANRQDEPTIRKTKSKRSSLFRSLTGGTRSSRSDEVAQSQQDLVHPSQAIPNDEISPIQREPVQVTNTQEHSPPTTNSTERMDTHMAAKMPSKYRNRLSRPGPRPAPPKEREQPPPEPAKKRRFSALGSLFGRSKDNKTSKNAQVDGLQKDSDRMMPDDLRRPKERTSRLSSLTKSGRGSAASSGKTADRVATYQTTRDSLAKEGLLSLQPRQSSSKSPEPSAYSETSSKQQQMISSRHQPLSQVAPRQEQRPSDWPRQSSSTSSNIQPRSMQAPDQHHRVQSTVTTRSSSRPQPDQRPRQLSSFTTTTTTTSSGGKTFTSTRQDSVARSNSPPPPPPPPKDTWHTTQRSHHRSTSGVSTIQEPRDPPVQTSNNHQSHVPANASNPPPQARTDSNQKHYSPARSMGTGSPPTPQIHPPRFPSTPNHQSLPPLQTNISHSSAGPAGPRPYNPNPDPDARKLRRSQIESSGTPRAESATIGANMSDLQAARNHRRSQIESAGGTPNKPNSAGAPEVVSSAPGGGGDRTGDHHLTGPGAGRKSEDEPIVMTATSFPGQEWQPSYAGWEEY